MGNGSSSVPDTVQIPSILIDGIVFNFYVDGQCIEERLAFGPDFQKQQEKKKSSKSSRKQNERDDTMSLFYWHVPHIPPTSYVRGEQSFHVDQIVAIYAGRQTYSFEKVNVSVPNECCMSIGYIIKEKKDTSQSDKTIERSTTEQDKLLYLDIEHPDPNIISLWYDAMLTLIKQRRSVGNGSVILPLLPEDLLLREKKWQESFREQKEKEKEEFQQLTELVKSLEKELYDSKQALNEQNMRFNEQQDFLKQVRTEFVDEKTKIVGEFETKEKVLEKTVSKLESKINLLMHMIAISEADFTKVSKSNERLMQEVKTSKEKASKYSLDKLAPQKNLIIGNTPTELPDIFQQQWKDMQHKNNVLTAFCAVYQADSEKLSKENAILNEQIDECQQRMKIYQHLLAVAEADFNAFAEKHNISVPVSYQ